MKSMRQARRYGVRGAILLVWFSVAAAPSGAVLAASGSVPFAIDQLENQKIVASDGSELQRFGESVALAGDTAMVGTNDTVTGRSAVYVFRRSAGSWTEVQKLQASDGAAGDQARFGASIALDGTTALIGADNATVGGSAGQGAVYVFTASGGHWTQVAKLTAADGAAGDAFGNAVALSGGAALIGAHKAQTNGHARGAAYLFTGAGGSWSQTQKIRGVDTRNGDAFGWRVAFAEDSIIVSAQLAFMDFPGALYFFKPSDTGWVQKQKVIGELYSNLGQSLAANGNRLVAGAPTLGTEGVIYVYTQIDGVWRRSHTIASPEGEEFASFGYSVGITDTAIVASATAANVNGQSWAGAGYVFTEANQAWRYDQKLIASDATSNDSLGTTAAIDGTTVLLASGVASPGGQFLQGAGYFFTALTGTRQPAATVAPDPLATAVTEGASRALALTVTNTGSATLDYSVAEGGCERPGDIAWLTLAATSGSLAPGRAGQVAVLADAAALGQGLHTATLCVLTNDPARATIDVPVELTVTPPDAPTPAIQVTPVSLDFTVASGASASRPLTIANGGGADLDYSLDQHAATALPPSYAAARLAAAQVATGERPSLHRAVRVASIPAAGVPAVLGDWAISQMADNTPGDEGLACGVVGKNTADNSWWRRFYFGEHPQVGRRAGITSVTVSSGSMGPNGLPITINLYTIAHSVPADTIPTSALTLIGTGSGTIDSGLVSVTIPVSGTIDDTAALDLVVEYHTPGIGNWLGLFFPGANATPETHPTFMSSVACELEEPIDAANLGLPNFHLTMIVNLGDVVPPGCQQASQIPWLSQTPASGRVAPGASAEVTVTANAAGLAAGAYAANLCVNSNDPANAQVAVPVSLVVEPATLSDDLFCDGFDAQGSGCRPLANDR
ncbi:FG-GAP repeat protein [Dokdonella koreensis]|uniref:Quinoprotein (ISS) n=1 Tax=Dokdonella koreensis DS-123 TaxID=1300342 RepID=A0A167GEL7_9GAMM|nr:FG-GAP repeat protein [Dokdonella koreensis]ANB16474.1 Quinoprotein (ISS) [Dokdonella koreensis DS-123]